MSRKKNTTGNPVDLSGSAPVSFESTPTPDDLMAKIRELEKHHIDRASEAKADAESNRAAMLLDKIEKEKGPDGKQSRNRESVEFQGREFSERQMYERKFWRNHNLGGLYVDPEMIPADEEWFWAAKEIGGQENLKSISTLLNKGWVFVRPSEAPDLCKANELSQEIGVKESNHIVHGASILLKRTKWIHEIEKDILMRRPNELEEGITNQTNTMSDDKIQSTFVSFNQGARSAGGLV